jgi:UDP-N-acetylglucosamine acyltransferase
MASPLVHPTAVIADGARIADGVRIGPYCVVGEHVTIGAGTELKSHVAIDGRTHLGERVTVYPFASLGHAPQDLKYQGEPSETFIGDDTVIREYVTINPGTAGGGMKTVVGKKCLLMAGAHVAHDCIVGDGVVMANNATLAGHVAVGDRAVIGGLAAVHQFVRIGESAMIGGLSGIENDVIPFGQAVGERASLVGLNLVGLKRGGFDREQIRALRDAFAVLFETNDNALLRARLDEAERQFADMPAVQKIVAFIRADSGRGVCRPKAEAREAP